MKDEFGVINIIGRTQSSNELSFNTKNPAIIDSKHTIAKLLIENKHKTVGNRIIIERICSNNGNSEIRFTPMLYKKKNSDNGTNFRGAEKVLGFAIRELETNFITKNLTTQVSK